MQQRVIRHRVERTKNKHSRAVIRDDTIVIRLARGLSPSEEREHIDDLLVRMKEQLKEEHKKTLINPFGRLLASGESTVVTLASGRKYRFMLRPGMRTKITQKRYGWQITVGPKLRRAGLHRSLWKALCIREQERMRTLVQKINRETFGVHITDVRLQFASSQWGSCSPKGVIMINAALLFAEPHILRYVIIHELAHRKRADHSPQYWNWVRWAMRDFRSAREKLHDYRLPTL
ncbi:M48 family metallopeptidase [Candidatus Peregrinibacteria bacterium]|nr:M48 family metallopeptidase [Candidatus Peregrinibacteria bacterium]